MKPKSLQTSIMKSKSAYQSRYQFPPSKTKRRGEEERNENWRDNSQFHITTTDESDSDSDTSMERRLEEKRQLEQAREDAEKANKAREEMESKLSKVMLELEQTKKSLDKEQRADEDQQNLKPKEQQKENHLEYARKFFQDNSASSTPGTMTLLARELERDLHLTDLNIGTKTTTYYTPPGETKLKFLTPAKQVVQNHKEAIETQKEKLQDIIRSIKLLETINNSGQFNKDIEMEQEKYQRLKQMYIEQREELLRVEQIAERYQPTLESPEFKIPPIDYRRQFGTLSMKNIINNVPKFDPDVESNKFAYTWHAILQFGRLEYFTEEEYKQVLSTVLLGSALDTYREMERQGHTLRQMLDTFADLYAPRNTIEEDQKEVDNFVRKAKEPIRTAMTRFSCMVDKIRCLSNPTSWMDIKYKMTKSVLKQVITIKTRQFIDYEEQKIKKVGGQFDMKELIELVHDYETSHNEVPTEDIAIVYCEASGEPAQWANDLQMRQKLMRQNRNIQEHTKHLANIIGQATTKVAASFVKGAQPKNKMRAEAALHQVQRPRSASASSQRSTRSDGYDTDVEMKEAQGYQKSASKNYRADNQSRGRQMNPSNNGQNREGQRPYSGDRYRPSSTDSGRYRPNSGDRSNVKASESNQYKPKMGENGNRRSYSNERQQNSASKDQRPDSRQRTLEARVSIGKDDGSIVFNNHAYYNCTCSSLHMIGHTCPKSGIPVHIKN